jgi:hypothetical protein
VFGVVWVPLIARLRFGGGVWVRKDSFRLVSMRPAEDADRGWGFYAFVIMKILIIQL